ncbi:hypothetical protein M23134_03773 [Microscilla marina ATCC 23134]|uniref:Uncharacterized protein n=1 Tax=Microscilla marina ATCC 23134 TaxID=313606 RepID=A1ZPG6_MICM2|nr:hypothetical protein M23134_03773 [Microscilla marina ATCC 23134]
MLFYLLNLIPPIFITWFPYVILAFFWLMEIYFINIIRIFSKLLTNQL